MKKKLLLALVIFALFIWVGNKAYQIAHDHAQKTLIHVKDRLKQLAGSKGHYSFSNAHISWLTQSVNIDNVDLVINKDIHVTARMVKVFPKARGQMTLLSINDLKINSPLFSGTIASLAINNLTVPLFNKNATDNYTLNLNDILNISYEQVTLRGAYFNTQWGKFRVGAWQISRVGSAKKRPYVFYNVDIAPKIWAKQQSFLDVIHLDQLILEMSDNRQFHEEERIASILMNTDYAVKAYGVTGFRFHKRRFSLGIFNGHISRQSSTWEGEFSGEQFGYILTPATSLFGEYLKRIGYSTIVGSFHANFTYYMDSHLVALHQLKYFSKDFLGMNLQSRFYLKSSLPEWIGGDWKSNILLKSFTLSLYDTGLKDHLFSVISASSDQPKWRILQDTLKKFDSYAVGKDFELDRQFYKTLADILRNPDNMMQLSLVFATSEQINNLLNMNFLDFFKLINQNNMSIVAVRKN
ncbi:hypothetical protein [Commensalibacter oyaizuii]|uniref:DUF945 domain-containing protein n=1 Tax=Commensalibacter oyaizuii TaxID=3043873 RepID=A0ABT6Q3Z0_9PROT|nr:hypothetical protein [Commensalibacter sp. TBRC 16381]MDI2091831.1 hypothetical protein [Commensalibacter sp. TBRC 16381]